MPFDQPTRNRLARFVGEARALLTEEFTRQLQQEYGLDPARGEVAELAKRRAWTMPAARPPVCCARHWRTTSAPSARCRTQEKGAPGNARPHRARAGVHGAQPVVRPAHGRGTRACCSNRWARATSPRAFSSTRAWPARALGETGDAYRTYLFSLFDEFAVDLPVLFDRFAPRAGSSRAEPALLKLLELINDPEISSRCGPRTRPSAGSTSTSTARKNARRCGPNRRPRATAASWPCATSSSPRATWSSSSPTTPWAASGTR